MSNQYPLLACVTALQLDNMLLSLLLIYNGIYHQTSHATGLVRGCNALSVMLDSFWPESFGCSTIESC